MAVAHDASSESHTGTTGSASEASFTWNHSGRAEASGGIMGVLVFTHNATSGSNDNATAVTYAGLAMTAVGSGRAVDTAGEPGECKAWFIGTGLVGKGGSQAIVVTRTNNADVMYASAVTVTAEGDTTTGTPVLLQGDGTLAESSVDDGSPGSNSVRYAAIFSGLASPPTVGASSTSLTSIDFGALGCAMARETTAGQGARSVGFSSGTSDDRAGVAIAVKIATVTVRTASESLTLGVTDNAGILKTQSVSDTISGLTEAVTTSINGLILVATSDALRVVISDDDIVSFEIATYDLFRAGLSENVVILNTQSISDAFSVGLTESPVISNVLASSDTLTFGLDDPDIIAFEYALFDLLGTHLTELATVVDTSSSITSVVGSELLRLGLTETATVVSTGVAAESLVMGLTETAAVAVTQSASDSLSMGLTETATPVVSVASSDTLLGLTESATERVNENRTDTLAITINEVTALVAGNLVQISASDSLAMVINDADITSFELRLIDTVKLGLTETATAGEAPVPVTPITASDSIAFIIDEPYLADTQVAASDSARMGLVETAAVVDLTGGSTTVSASDIFKAGLTELAVVKVIQSVSDTVGLIIDEPYTDDTQVIASDSPKMGLTETATVVDLSAGLVTQSTLDIMRTGLTEDSLVKANISASDTVVTGLIEFATVEVNEQVLRTTPDSLGMVVEEAVEINVTQPASELLTLGLTENVAIAATLDAVSEALGMGLQETANIVDLTGGAALLTSAEVLHVGLAEDAASYLNSPVEDVLPMGLTETATIAVVIVASDSVGMGLGEAVSMQVNINVSEDLPAGLTEAILQTIIASVQDGVGFVLDDTVNAVKGFLTGSDVVVLGVTELSDLIDIGGVATKTASDTLAMHLSENGVVHSVTIQGPHILVATVEYLGPKTAEVLDMPKEAELWH